MIRIDRLVTIFLIFFTLIDAEENQTTCWSPETIYKISFTDINNTNRTYNSTETELVEECHLSFVEKITQKTCSKPRDSSRQQPPFIQRYGYGFLSVFIISVLSLAAFVAFPLMKKPYYKYLNAFFTALAVGTLFANSSFELFPVIIKYGLASSSSHTHEHGQITSNKQSNGKLHIPLYMWQMAVLMISAYVFYCIELIIHAYINRREHRGKKNSYDLNHEELPSSEMGMLPIRTLSKSVENHGIISTNTLPNLIVTAHDHQKKSTGWMIIIGDGIHNVADGLAIGAAFAESTMFGVTTSVAIACHELPTELGEYMVLIESGFTIRRALLFNFVSACTAIIGFFIGASMGQDEASRTWIFAITAGTFAYIALVNLWPTLMPETQKFDWIRFICVTLGYLSGICVMFILTIFDERIVQSPSAI